MERRAYIALEGPIGVGKTTLAQVLARELNARLLLEEAEENPFLARFYEDPDKYAIPVQLYFLLTRYNQQRELLQHPLLEQATVADYLFAKDRIFANLNLAPDELIFMSRSTSCSIRRWRSRTWWCISSRGWRFWRSGCGGAIAISNATSATSTSSGC